MSQDLTCVGGGNLGHGDNQKAIWSQQYKILREKNVYSGRINVYPGDYVSRDWSTPNATSIESSMLEALLNNNEPVLLFEYYSSYYPTLGLGTWDQW